MTISSRKSLLSRLQGRFDGFKKREISMNVLTVKYERPDWNSPSQEVLASPKSMRVPGIKNMGFGTSAVKSNY
jgi:hypothetical protein